MVQAAGDHRPVPQYPHLVPQAVAEGGPVPLRGGQVGPVKYLAPLQKDARGQGGPPTPFLPGPGESPLQSGQDGPILPVGPSGACAVQIPQPQGAPLPPGRGGAGKAETPVQIVRQPGPLVPLEGVEGDAHPLHRRTGQQQPAPFLQKSPVGGDHHPEAQRPGPPQDLLQLGMGQWLPHEVEVQIFRVGPQPSGQQGKILRGQKARRPPGAWTERAGQVAQVCNFQIGLFQHPLAPFGDHPTTDGGSGQRRTPSMWRNRTS